MIIKEFRIIIPMSVDEYQIGQLYTIQKKSRLESTGAGSGVEIIENKPYESKNEKGQYTLKVYHVDERLPSGLKTISKLLFPKSALLFEEESWNCYPYTRTKYKHKLFKSFNIDIESKYNSDYGQTDNVFNLNSSELSARTVDFIDIVTDPINPNEYKLDEDPSKFISKKTQRGPLLPNWAEELKANATQTTSIVNNKQVKYMCAYKLCRIECAFWGCQSRVEKLISESVLRHMILMSHRQAWCWQDEYVDLTMDDVRRLEAETQQYLNQKMRNDHDSIEVEKNEKSIKKDNKIDSKSNINEKSSEKLVPQLEPSSFSILIDTRPQKQESSKNTFNEEKSDYEDFQSQDEQTEINNFKNENYANGKYNENITSSEKLAQQNDFDQNIFNDDSDFGDNEEDENEDEKDNVSQNSNFDEFYDAISQISFSLSTNTNDSETKSTNSLNLASPLSQKLNKQRFLSRIKPRINSDSNNVSVLNTNTKNMSKSKKETTFEKIVSTSTKSADGQSTSTTFNSAFTSSSSSSPNKNNKHSSKNSSGSICKIDTLIIVVHGGNVTCTDTSKQSDFSNFKSTMESVIKTNYGNVYGKVAYRLVSSDPICKEALIKLSALSPVANEQSFSLNDSDEFAETSATVFSLHENLPFSTLPLLALANHNQYRLNLTKFIRECNKVYQEFLNSSEGQSFQGQVVIVGDSVGSLLVYDSLCQSSSSNSNCSDDSSTLASSVGSLQLNQQSSINSQKSPNTNRKFTPVSSPNSPRKIDNNNPLINLNDKTYIETLEKPPNNNNPNIKRNPSSVSSSSGIEFTAVPYLSPPANNNFSQFMNSISCEEKLDFDVTHFFVFGSPLGLVLAYRKLAFGSLDLPCCSQIYNLFHLTDPIAVRIEPLLCKQFRSIEPCMIPRYSKFPLGDGSNLSLDHFIVKHGHLFDTKNLLAANNDNQTKAAKSERLTSLNINESPSNNYLTPNFDQLKSLQKIIQTKKSWWGDNRIDYVLYAPEKIANLPRKSLPYIFHSCFWESTDVVSFMLRMIFKSDSNIFKVTPDTTTFNNTKEPVEKWQKRLNRVKLRNLSANHRANDVIVLEDKEQILTAKFSYGPLDFVLSGEKVDIYIMAKPSSNGGEWKFYATELTDNHGKLKYEIPKEKRLPQGMYQIKMVVKCDHTYAEFYMSVLPANTETVVFSIDGSFAANISFSGTDPKVRAGAVDVVRHWQDLGYLIIYITARPDIQHYKVTNWLAQHNFPLGMVYFSDGLSRDPIRQKTETLKNIVVNSNIKLQAAYGSSKDIPMYSSLGLNSNRIFIIGKMRNKYSNQAVILRDGYASHLNALQNPNSVFRQASGNARLIIKKISFSIRQNTLFSNNNENISNTINSINSNNTNLTNMGFINTSNFSINNSHLAQNYNNQNSISSV